MNRCPRWPLTLVGACSLVGLVMCSDSSEEATGSAGQAGVGGGTAGSQPGTGGNPVDASPPLDGAGDQGGAGGLDAGSECSWPQGTGATDPTPGPLDCTRMTNYFDVTGALQGGLLTLTFDWCGCTNPACVYMGDVANLSVVVLPELGTLQSSDFTCGGSSVVIQLDDVATFGDILLRGEIAGRDECYEVATCPIENTYRVSVAPTGDVEVEVQP